MSQGYKYADESLSIIAAMDFLKTHVTTDRTYACRSFVPQSVRL